MSMSNEYIIDKIDEATEINREAKRLCNDALCLARGKIQKLQNEIVEKDAHILELRVDVAKLKSELLDLKAREMVEGNCVIVQDSSGNLTIKCSSGSDEDRWIPCSERMPEQFKDSFIIVMDTWFCERHIVPRVGYFDGKEWRIYGVPGETRGLPSQYKIVGWRPVPENYKEFKVEDAESEPVEEEVKFEIGDFVLCVSKGGTKINAIYTGEDDEHYWVLDKNCEVPQHLYKNQWKLIKYPGYMSVMDWLTGEPVS